MTNSRLLSAQLYGIAVKSREQARELFEFSPDDTRSVVLLDLVASTNFRFFRGPTEAYERTMVFYSLCHHIFGSAGTLQIIKEMGDGILAVGSDAKEVLNACIAFRRVERMIRSDFEDDRFPFRVRIGVGHGVLKRLAGRSPDFLGSTIDELSRIMADKTDDGAILLSESFRELAAEFLEQYPFASIGGRRSWTDKDAHVAHEPIDYYPVFVDFNKITD